MSSCSAFLLSPVLYLEIYFECWFRSAQIHSAVGHLQAAGQLLAHTLLRRGPLVMGFFMLRLPRSWYHMSPQKQGSGAHQWPTATTHGERPRAPCQEVGLKERKKPNTFLNLKERRTPILPPTPKRCKGLSEFKSQEQLCEDCQQEADYKQNRNISPQMSPNWRTHGCMKIKIHQPAWGSVLVHAESLCRLATTSTAALK